MPTNTDSGGPTQAAGFLPPYTSFRTMLSLIERMEAEGGVPSRVDRSYLSNVPGSSQTMLLAGLKSLGLIDSQARPTADLIQLVEDPGGRPAAIRGLIEAKYTHPIELGRNATQQQLEEAFREYGITGSTLRKAIAFFLAAARFAEIPVSPHFRTPKPVASGNERKSRRRREPEPRKSSQANGTGNNSGTGGGGEGASDSTQFATDNPILVGLFQALPAVPKNWPLTKGTFPEAGRKAWLEAAKANFDVLYNSDPDDQRGGGE